MYILYTCIIHVRICTLSLLNSWWFQLESQQIVVFGIQIYMYTLLQIHVQTLRICTLYNSDFVKQPKHIHMEVDKAF